MISEFSHRGKLLMVVKKMNLHQFMFLSTIISASIAKYKNVLADAFTMFFFSTAAILGPFLFSVYINHFLEGLTTNAILFASNVSVFSVDNNVNLSVTNLNSDLS